TFGPTHDGYSSDPWFGDPLATPPNTPTISPSPQPPLVPAGLGLMPNGQLILGGTFFLPPGSGQSTSSSGSTTGIFLARLNADGSLDRNFGYCGVFESTFGGTATLNALTVQSDGKTVGVGTINGQTAVMRFLTN